MAGSAGTKASASEKLAIDAPDSLRGRVGHELEQPLLVHGGVGPYSWSLIGAPPAWLELAAHGEADATLTAVPEHSGRFSISVRVEAADGERVTIERELVVEPKRWAVYDGPDPEAPESGSLLAVELDPAGAAPATPRVVVRDSSGPPVWSGDGSWLVATSRTGSTLLIVDMGGSEPGATNELAFPGEGLVVRAAPAGQHFLVETSDVPAPCDPICVTHYHFYDLDPGQPADAQLTTLVEDTNVQRTIAWSPDGRQVLFQTAVDPKAALRLFDLDTRSLLEIPNHGAGTLLEHDAWSPDGRWIALARLSPTDSLRLLDVSAVPKGADVTAADSTELAGGLDAWSPDGTRLIIWGQSSQPSLEYQARLVDVSGTTPHSSEPLALPFATTPMTFDFLPARWSADGSRFALTLGPAPLQLVVFDAAHVESGPIWWRPLAHTEIPFVAWTPDGSLLFRQGQTLFLKSSDLSEEPMAIAEDAGPDTMYGTDILLSPDHRALAYRPTSGDGQLRFVALEPAVEQRAVPFAGIPLTSDPRSSAWLADGSGLLALTRDRGSMEQPLRQCGAGCRFEYAFVSADGELQQARSAQGTTLNSGLYPQP